MPVLAPLPLFAATAHEAMLLTNPSAMALFNGLWLDAQRRTETGYASDDLSQLAGVLLALASAIVKSCNEPADHDVAAAQMARLFEEAVSNPDGKKLP